MPDKESWVTAVFVECSATVYTVVSPVINDIVAEIHVSGTSGKTGIAAGVAGYQVVMI